jgi:diguanylate cyclase (GGDEF)-like protein/PAS domain S-box-containing protein
MLRDHCSYVLIARQNRPTGILTERDITALLVCIKEGQEKTILLRDVMHTPVQTVLHRTPVFVAASRMQEELIRHMAVVDADGKIMGMLSLHNLMERVTPFLLQDRAWQQQHQMETTLLLSEQRLHMAIEASGIGFWEFDLIQRKLRYSETLQDVLGLEAGEAPANLDEWMKCCHPDDSARVAENYVSALDMDNPLVEVECRMSTKDGGWLWMQIRGRIVQRDATGCPELAVGTALNITARKQVEEALRESEQRLRAIFETEPECVKILDARGHLLEINPAGLAMLEADSIADVKQKPLLEYVLAEHRHAFGRLFMRVMSGESGTLIFEMQGLRGARRWLEIHAVPMRDVKGAVTRLLSVTRDITERRRAEENIHYMANFDQLTGLPNRAQLEARAKYALSLAQRNQGLLGVIFLDLDRFKDINDTLGHSIGDALLVEAAKRMKSVVREEDTVSRLGGDEFVLLLPGVDARGAAQVAQKLLETIAQTYRIEPYDLNVTASMGIALYPEDGRDLETLSKNADAAMYRAKQAGRHDYRFYTAEMQARSGRNLQLVNALRHALAANQLQLVYQPQLSMSDGRIIGAEALLRWYHPELGQVSPAEFIPVAEDSGLILPIGEWVLRTAALQVKRWMDEGCAPLIMAVNLSAVQFRHVDLPELVSRILDETGLPPEYLELELTEGVAMHDPQGAIAVMNDLHDRGIRLSIDDFGTGYSSLSYLKKFRVYKLKIDQSFVRDISTDPEDKAIVSAIISMAQRLGMQTIAEGVETAGQLSFLREQGCNEVQGYYYSKPLPVEQFEVFSRKHRL